MIIATVLFAVELLSTSSPWTLLAAALIPFLSAAAFAPQAKTSWRTGFALVASALLAGAEAVAQAGDVEVSQLGATFATAVIVQFTSYTVSNDGLKLDLNNRVLPQVGAGKPAVVEDY